MWRRRKNDCWEKDIAPFVNVSYRSSRLPRWDWVEVTVVEAYVLTEPEKEGDAGTGFKRRRYFAVGERGRRRRSSVSLVESDSVPTLMDGANSSLGRMASGGSRQMIVVNGHGSDIVESQERALRMVCS